MKQFHKIFCLSLINLFLVSWSCTFQTKLELLNYNSSECKEVYFKNLYKLQNRILGISKTDNFHIYNLFIVANCSSTEEGEIEIKNDTLNLVFHGKREHRVLKEKKNDSIEIVTEEWIEELADCNCAFNLTYKIKGLKNKDYIITANGKRIIKSEHKFKIRRKKPSFEIADNDTINYIDIYGLKQGLHIRNRKDGKLFSKINYLDDEKVSGLAKTYYDLNGFDKIDVFMENREFSISKYYKNGKLIKVCDNDGIFAEGTNCKYFD